MRVFELIWIQKEMLLFCSRQLQGIGGGIRLAKRFSRPVEGMACRRRYGDMGYVFRSMINEKREPDGSVSLKYDIRKEGNVSVVTLAEQRKVFDLEDGGPLPIDVKNRLVEEEKVFNEDKVFNEEKVKDEEMESQRGEEAVELENVLKDCGDQEKKVVSKNFVLPSSDKRNKNYSHKEVSLRLGREGLKHSGLYTKETHLKKLVGSEKRKPPILPWRPKKLLSREQMEACRELAKVG